MIVFRNYLIIIKFQLERKRSAEGERMCYGKDTRSINGFSKLEKEHKVKRRTYQYIIGTVRRAFTEGQLYERKDKRQNNQK